MPEPHLDKIPTFVKGLDEKMDGGMVPGSIVLVAGKAGSMKSTLAFTIAFNLARTRKAYTFYLSFEQRKESILEQMGKLGIDSKLTPTMTVLDIKSFRKIWSDDEGKQENWLQMVLKGLGEFKHVKGGLDLLVIDSLDALFSVSEVEADHRTHFFNFMEGLRDLGLTVLIITEMKEGDQSYSQYWFDTFLVDGIIHMELERAGKTVNLQIGIPKMRKCRHTRSYFPLIFDESGFRVVAKE